jgi:possible integrase
VYREFCAAKRITISYSRKGNPYDNACIESFHTTLKKEYVHNKKFESLETLKAGIYDYIEMWYNKKGCIVS